MVNDLWFSRFVDAQFGTYQQALDQISRGRKVSCWMWFIFPQLLGLGHSAKSAQFGIPDLEHARAYLAHPVLGPRLMECARAIPLSGRPTAAIFGMDTEKLHASLTLFSHVETVGLFGHTNTRLFGRLHPETEQLLIG